MTTLFYIWNFMKNVASICSVTEHYKLNTVSTFLIIFMICLCQTVVILHSRLPYFWQYRHTSLYDALLDNISLLRLPLLYPTFSFYNGLNSLLRVPSRGHAQNGRRKHKSTDMSSDHSTTKTLMASHNTTMLTMTMALGSCQWHRTFTTVIRLYYGSIFSWFSVIT